MQFSIKEGTFCVRHCFDWRWRRCFAFFSSNVHIWCRWGNLDLSLSMTEKSESCGTCWCKSKAVSVILLSFTFLLGIILDLLHLKKPGGFDISLFYRDIINVAEDEDLGIQPDESGKLEDLMKKVRAKETRKRALVRCVSCYGVSFSGSNWILFSDCISPTSSGKIGL